MPEEVGTTADQITIKGISQGLLVVLGSGDWADHLDALTTRLNDNPQFFTGGQIALDVGNRQLSKAQVEEIRDLLTSHRVSMWALFSEHPATQAAVQEVGLVAALEAPQPRALKMPTDAVGVSATDGLVQRRTLRSGQNLRHPGHIVVIGDVNPGAEVIAGGDIVVWGRLRGVVHAGALGDEDAVICALDLSPTQLRIAHHIARSPEERRRKAHPEMALVRDGQIVAVSWRGRLTDWAGSREKQWQQL